MNRLDPVTDILSAVADPTRRQILDWLREQPMTVGAIVEKVGISQPGVTRHLGQLERAGLIKRRAEGRLRICELRPAGLSPLDAWLAEYRQFWESALDRLATIAEEAADDDRTRNDD